MNIYIAKTFYWMEVSGLSHQAAFIPPGSPDSRLHSGTDKKDEVNFGVEA